MSVPSDLIHILKYHGFIKKSEAEPFHRYVENSKEETYRTEDLLPTTPEEVRLEKTLVNRANNLKVFLHIILGVERFLRRKLTAEVFDRAVANYPKTIGYIEHTFSDDPIKKEQTKRYLRDTLPKEVIERTIFDVLNIDGGKECVFIPIDAFIAVPYRGDDEMAMFIRDYGTPIEVILRKGGRLKGKLSIPECHYHIRRVIFFKIAPAIDLGVEGGKLTQYEYDYIKKFVYKINYLMGMYEGVKKGSINKESDRPLTPSKTYAISNKSIENTIKNLLKSGADPRWVDSVRSAAFKNREKVKCINSHCKNTFLPINKNHKRCQDCSKPGIYLKEWRALHGDRENWNPKQGQPPPEKIITIRFIDIAKLEELKAD